MSMNVFAWIREGVRQSVLAGVSDAIEQMGPAVDGDDIRGRMADLMSRPTPAIEGAPVGEARPRRLGRTLKDFDLGKDKS